MQFRSPWFWVLFGVSVVSAVCGVVIHEFSFFTVFAPLWCFFVASPLVQTLRTGCLDDEAGPTFRSRQPVKFWLRSAFWCLGYCFAVYLPIGYALQERDELKAKVEAAAKRKVREEGWRALIDALARFHLSAMNEEGAAPADGGPDGFAGLAGEVGSGLIAQRVGRMRDIEERAGIAAAGLVNAMRMLMMLSGWCAAFSMPALAPSCHRYGRWMMSPQPS